MATRKIKGGDINLNRVFRRILSVGFEYETGFLTKLTLVEDTDEDGNPVNILLNTDTARDNIKDLEDSSLDESNPYYDDYVLRQNETMELPVYNREGKRDTNSKFYVTNDIASSPFLKYLENFCVNSTPKNEQYKFITTTGDEYDFNFSFWKEDTDCSVFANVEWVFTYYKPTISSNIVLDCFFNSMKNLNAHLEDMEPIEGTFKIVAGNEQIEVDKPIIRKLYKSKKDNLYYMQTHYKNLDLTLDDVCMTMQMTFSTHITNAFSVMKAFLKDNLQTIAEQTELSEERYKMLKKIELCGDRLFASYNAKNEKKIRIKKNTQTYHEMMNYIYLILFKLSIYYNYYLTKDKKTRGYFKNSMFLNPRHANVVFYEALKDLIMKSMKWNEEDTINAIRKLFIQEDILLKDLLDNPKNVRKNAFKMENRIEKSASKYGDPYSSLISYFEFFESPVENENNKNAMGELYYDYLEYAEIDALSNKFDYNDKIILIEMRSFPRLITSYFKKIATPEVNKLMNESICKKFRPNLKEEITSHPISNITKFIKIYEADKPASPSQKKQKKIINNKTLRLKKALTRKSGNITRKLN